MDCQKLPGAHILRLLLSDWLSCGMKIPIQLTYKYFSETITIKKKVDSLHIGDTMEMYKGIIVPIYGQENYERVIITLAQRIMEQRRKKEPKTLFKRIVDKILYY